MPPIIALLICSAFVVFLLKIDYQRSGGWTLFSWIPTIWMLYCGSRPIGLWFGRGERLYAEDLSTAIIEGSPMDRIFLLVLILSGLFILITREIDWHQVVEDNRWLFILFFYMFLSILWSEYPYVSLKRWVKVSGGVVMALVVATGPSPLKAFESILRRVAYILIPFSVLLVKYYPHFGVKWGRWSGEPSWEGVCMGKNALGTLCMISILFFIWTWLKGKRDVEQSIDGVEIITYAMISLMAFWLQKGPGIGMFSSATSVIVFIIGFIALFALRKMDNNSNLEMITIIFLFLIGLVYLILWEFLSINPIDIIASMVGRDPTLTGRTDVIWRYVIPICMDNYLFGKGYGGFWIVPLELDKFTVNQAHNGYLDVFVELGLVGMILFVIVILVYIRRAADLFKNNIEWGSFMLVFLMMLMVHNFAESSYLKSTAFLWNIYIIFMFLPTGDIDTVVKEKISNLTETSLNISSS